VWFSPPCCPVQVLLCALCLHHVFLSEQIKMMMMMMNLYEANAVVGIVYVVDETYYYVGHMP